MKTTHLVGIVAVLGIAAYFVFKPRPAQAKSAAATRQSLTELRSQAELDYTRSLGGFNG